MSKQKKSTPNKKPAGTVATPAAPVVTPSAPLPVVTAMPTANAQAALQGSPAAPKKKRKIVSLDKK